MQLKCQLIGIMLYVVANPNFAQSTVNDDLIIKSLELRNYTLMPGMREKFSSYMDKIIIPRQASLGGHLMNAFSLKGPGYKPDDHYVWIRGFADMHVRSKFLKDFYYSDYWRLHAAECNSMLIDSYDVHLLKPLQIKEQQIDSTAGIKLNLLRKPTGITIATHYVTNQQRNKLINLFLTEYLQVFKQANIEVLALLISETQENDYNRQNVYQDPNLLVVLTHFSDEATYRTTLKKVNELTPDQLKKQLKDVLVSSESLILQSL